MVRLSPSHFALFFDSIEDGAHFSLQTGWSWFLRLLLCSFGLLWFLRGVQAEWMYVAYLDQSDISSSLFFWALCARGSGFVTALSRFELVRFK